MNAIKELSNESDAITGMRSLRPKSGVLAIASYGIRIAVERGHLCIEDAVVSSADTAPRFLLRDRDSSYGSVFEAMLRETGCLLDEYLSASAYRLVGALWQCPQCFIHRYALRPPFVSVL